MNARDFARKTYREYIENHLLIPTEFKRALKTHERVPRFIDNLSAQLLKIPGGIKRENIKKCVEDMTEMFWRAAMRKADEAAMSPLERALIRTQFERKQAAEKLSDDLFGGGNTNETQIQTEKGVVHKSETVI